jgi:excisionase family DNA binding protein
MRRSVFVEEAAALLGVSRRTVYYRIRDGRLQTVRTRGGSQRVLVESIEALLRSERDEGVEGVEGEGVADRSRARAAVAGPAAGPTASGPPIGPPV